LPCRQSRRPALSSRMPPPHWIAAGYVNPGIACSSPPPLLAPAFAHERPTGTAPRCLERLRGRQTLNWTRLEP
jgi:hypothetical protein